MTRLRFYLLAAVFCSLTVLGQGDISVLTNSDPTPSHTEPSTVNVKSDSTTVVTTLEDPASKHKTTTTEKTTTSSTTTTTTTTTTTPPPTTTSTTTTPAPTPAPTPTPTPAPTPAPGPAPAPKQGKWVYKDSKNATCIVVQFAAQLNVTYTKAANSSLQYFVVNVPPTAAVVDGNCNGTEQWLNLSWPVKNETVNATYNNMVLYFHQNATTKMYSLKYLNISLAPEMFPNSSNTKAPVEFWHGVEWTTPLATSYRCATPTQLNMTSDMAAATLTLSQLQEEAFRTAKDETFSAARECSGADVPDAVPIAVGCALGALVVVVLVAYLVARRRSAAQGYLSM